MKQQLKYFSIVIASLITVAAIGLPEMSKKVILKKPKSSTNTKGRIPIVFSKEYDISILGLEKFHPFDSKKYGKVYKHLIHKTGVPESSIFTPEPVTNDQLKQVHTEDYINALNQSSNIAQVAEMPALSKVPKGILHSSLLKPVKYATGGTILGAQLALDSGYAINLSGGYHHAKANNGEGFCFFADINLAIIELQKQNPDIKVMIIDLDAHQGNGHESVTGTEENIVIFDMYNSEIYPGDDDVKQYIDYDFPLESGTTDDHYLSILKKELPKALNESKPDLIIYNAGTDIYSKDPLGALGVSEQGIIKRDEFVFHQAIMGDIPILMVLSGGYTKESSGIIARSIENVIEKNNL